MYTPKPKLVNPEPRIDMSSPSQMIRKDFIPVGGAIALGGIAISDIEIGVLFGVFRGQLVIVTGIE